MTLLSAGKTGNYPAVSTRRAPYHNSRFSIKFYDPDKFRYCVDFAMQSINPGIAWLIRQTHTTWLPCRFCIHGGVIFIALSREEMETKRFHD